MKKLKVMTVVGTRPEIIRLSRVMSILDESRRFMATRVGLVGYDSLSHSQHPSS